MTVPTVSHSFDLDLHLLSSTIYTKLDAITLAEIVLGESKTHTFTRVLDSDTGFNELEIIGD